MKFRIVENLDEDDILNEAVLTEDVLYKVEVPNPKITTGGPRKIFYFLSGDDVNKFTSMATCDEVVDYVEHTLGEKGHEKINKALLSQLKALCPSSVAVSDMSAHKSAILSYKNHTNRFLNTTYSQSRTKSNTAVIRDIGVTNKRLFKNLTVHHLDGDEWNDSATNLVGFDSNQLHQLAHILPIVSSGGSSYTWSKRFNAVVYDGRNFIIKPCIVTMEIR